MHVITCKYVLGKGFGCTGTLTDDIIIWTALLILNFLKTLQNDCCTLRATMVDQPFWGYFTSPLKQLLNACQPRFDTQQYNTVLTCFPLPYW